MEPLRWYLVAGIVLCAMAIAATLIRRLPLSSSMLYLPIGWALGANGLNAIDINLKNDAAVLEQITKAIILISLFSAGLKMRLPITSRLWFLSLRLAFFSMVITVGLIAVTGIFIFGMPPAIAILMGGMLAPTDPVLASEVQVDDPYQLGALRFGLTSEAGLNDGSAFPFVLLGLMLLTKPFSSSAAWRWFGVDFCWGTLAGLLVGFGVAALVGNYVLHLRTVHRHALGLGFFLAPGLIAFSYALGEMAHGYGFLSVFASAVTLRWIEMRRAGPGKIPELPLIAAGGAADVRFKAAVDPSTAPIFLVESLLQFTDQLEQIGELVIVVIVGALLTRTTFVAQDVLPLILLFFVIRPVAIFAGLARTPLGLAEKGLMSWFGIRGIGSLYYLLYAIQHGLPSSRIDAVANTIMAAIAISVAMHGITVTPLMSGYSRRRKLDLAARS
ncbi:MAG TPA: cation:proton antiporter [Terriglobales bacterium]|nr:cation:proton antiporter [Terriglobales bacterium]